MSEWLSASLVQQDAEWKRRELHRRPAQRIIVPLVTWYDWDSLRANVYHHVAPGLVKWR